MRALRANTTTLLFSAFLLAATLGSGAKASTVVSWTGGNKFDSAAMPVTPFAANQLTAITGDGTYEGSTSLTYFGLYVDLSTNGGSSYDWTLLHQWSVAANAPAAYLSSLLSSPVYFAMGLVRGIQLTSAPVGPTNDPNYQLFNKATGEQFTFNTPLPAALPLFAGGLVLVGLLSRRRKQAAG